MEKPMSALDFRLMTFGFRVRDMIRPRIDILREVGIRPGSSVLDYGCGPGGYIPPLAQLVGPTGRIYALDVNPAAIEATRRLARRKKIENLKLILSDCSTGLAEESLDAVLLYDTFHHLSQPDEVLRELYRVVKAEGVLSFSDHHLEKQDIIAGVTDSGMFGLAREGRRTYSFAKKIVTKEE
jgi:ubiquinone/menaquinone biosynthesis C-methylase UbiE